MKLLVTGRNGQLARSIAELGADRPDLEIEFAGRPSVDLEQPGSLATAIERSRPDVVVNAAAYTGVDAAETEPDRAMRINAAAAGEGAEAAARIAARFIQLSTDYVFDGRSDRPYREDDETGPLNVYGASKLAGEEAVLAAFPSATVVRTAWVVSPFGSNFVTTMLRLAGERDEIAVVDDQYGSPTVAADLAGALLDLTHRRDALPGGVLHLAGDGQASWADVAERVMLASARQGGPSAAIRRIGSADYPTPAARPLFTVLDCTKAEKDLSLRLPPWQVRVEQIVERLVKRGG